MQTLAWEQLFRAIPEQHRNNLSIVTRAGIEITIQALLRVEPECVAVRGRLAGSQDAGRVFFIPYEQIDHVGFIREMKEAEFNEIFADLVFPQRATDAAAATTKTMLAPATTETVAPLEDVPLQPIAPSTKPLSRMNIPIKSEVLERFRNRTSTPGKPVNGEEGA